MDIVAYNRTAWNKESQGDSPWCQPVSAEKIQQAKQGDWSVILTPNKSVPADWFGDVKGQRILCLASGGGQQAPTLSAAGASVVSFDNSDEQLAKDKMVADRDSLDLETVQGDMADLSIFEDGTFDLIFHPVSNVFAQDIRPVWKECSRVLKTKGRLLSGFMNPAFFYFDHEQAEKSGTLEAKYRLPYSDLTSLPPEKLKEFEDKGLAYEFGHTLEDQIGGQLAAGFIITGLYEDDWNDEATPLNKLGPLYLSTLAQKISAKDL